MPRMSVRQLVALNKGILANDVEAIADVIAGVDLHDRDDVLELPYLDFLKRVREIAASMQQIELDKLPECADPFDLAKVSARQMGKFYRATTRGDFELIADTLKAASGREYMDCDVSELMAAARAFMEVVKKSASA